MATPPGGAAVLQLVVHSAFDGQENEIILKPGTSIFQIKFNGEICFVEFLDEEAPHFCHRRV